ncbi:MAG: uncharacterized protein K0S45_532 [Nitrospira sp.]|jgi:hypothetical protein|nr:uncharacterized protein [Nitrospira sp.]
MIRLSACSSPNRIGLENIHWALQRINLHSDATILLPTDGPYETVKQRYLERFPQSRMMFGFGDHKPEKAANTSPTSSSPFL